MTLARKILGAVGLTVTVVMAGMGQQSTQYSLFMLDKYQYNPAFAGLDFSISANLHYRNQWDDLAGNPQDISINVHSPMYAWRGAVGGLIEHRTFGVFTETHVAGSYNYVTDIGEGLWSLGARVGVSRMAISGASILTPDGDYNSGINHNDPLLPTNTLASFAPRWDIGTYYYTKTYQVGAAIASLPSSIVSVGDADLTHATHLNLYGQYDISFLEEYRLMTAILLKTDFAEVQTDVSIMLRNSGNIFGGITLRGYNSNSLDAVGFLFGIALDEHYTLSYSYDLGVSGLRRAHEGSHEILLNYNLRRAVGGRKLPKIIYNPRYL